jgi:maltooligosyltrehalose trehalohydrolase
MNKGEHREWRRLYRKLLALRHSEIVPRLQNIRGNSGRYEVLGYQAVKVCWLLGDGSELSLIANLGTARLEGPIAVEGKELWRQGAASAEGIDPWTVVFSLRVADGRGN